MDQKIVGRAELKLAEATQAFGYDFRGKAVLDIGSSTGGFTEYALRRGARRVIAIEKGTHQMKSPLRYDPRIDLHEKTDFLQLAPNTHHTSSPAESAQNQLANPPISRISPAYSPAKATPPQGENPLELVKPLQVAPDFDVSALRQVDVVLADISFLSLTQILAHAQRLVNPRADYLVMLKPQFEARPDQLIKGVVKNERMRRDILQNFERWLTRHGFLIIKKRDNRTTGKRGGNIERFYWLRRSK